MRNTVIFNLSLCLGLANILTHAQALADPAGQVHVVKKGETLWDIAGQYLQNPTDWTQIQKLNALGTPQSLQVGTELNIPLLDNAFPVKVLHLQGQAWLIVKGQTERPLAQGMKLDVGQRVRTGEASFVTLGFGDGTKTVLPPLSLVTLSLGQQYETPQILLHQGEVESYVPKQATPGNSFEVITPKAYSVFAAHTFGCVSTPRTNPWSRCWAVESWPAQPKQHTALKPRSAPIRVWCCPTKAHSGSARCCPPLKVPNERRQAPTTLIGKSVLTPYWEQPNTLRRCRTPPIS